MAKTDSSTRAIQDIVRKSVGTVSRYGTGIGKLFLASTKEFMVTNMPAPAAFLETNKAVLDDSIKFLRNPVDAINKGVNRAMDTDDFKALTKFAKNALDDLKTGNLYDAERSRDSLGMQMDADMSEFGGFDMSGFDENGDWSGDFDDSEFDKQIALAEAQDKNQAKRTEATIDAIGASTNAIVDTENANAQVSLRMSMKQHSQNMQAMQSMVAAQTATFELINKSINSAMDVSRETHNQIMSSLSTITDTLNQIRDNTKPKETEKTQYKERDSVFATNGALDVKKYLKQVVKNVDEKYGVSSLYSTVTMGGGIKGLLEMVGDNPWQLVSDLIVGNLAGPKVTKQMQQTNRNMEAFIPALLQKWADRGKLVENGKSNKLSDALLGFLGIDTRSRATIDTEYENPLAAASFTTKTTRAIEEVIPMWLARIDSHISGQPLMVYNYSTGKLERARDIIASGERSSRDLVGRMGDGAREIINRAGAYNFKTDDEKDKFVDFVYKFIQKQASESNFINPYQSKEDFLDMMPMTDTINQRNKYYNLLMGIMKAMPRDQLISLSNEIMGARHSRDRDNFSLNENLKSNGTIAAWSFMNQDMIDRISSKAMSKNYALTSDEIDKISEAKKKEIIASGGARATNFLLQEMTNILKKGIITYSYSLGSVNSNTTAVSSVTRSPTRRIAIPSRRVSTDGFVNDDLKKIIENVQSVSEKQYNNETNIAERAYHELQRVRDYTRRQEESSNEKMKDNSRSDTEQFVTNDITEDRALDVQIGKTINATEEDESNNPEVERRRKGQENYQKVVGLNINGSLNEIAKKTGAAKIFAMLRTASEEPFRLFGEGMKLMDAFMFKALFGEDAANGIEASGEPYLLQVLTNSLNVHFKQAKDVIKDVVADPVRKYLLDDKTGLLPRIGTKLKEIADPFINKTKDRIFGTKDESGQRQGGLVGKAKDKLIGKKDESGKYTNGIFSGIANSMGDKSLDLQTRVNNAVDQVLWGDYANKERRGVNKTSEGLGVGGDGSYNPDDYQGVMGKLKLQFDKFNYFMFGSEDANSKLQLVKKNLNEAAPDMIIGAGAGLLTSFFLPGGPVLGAVLGGAAGLLKGSSDLKDFLFGKEFDTEETYIDKKTGKTVTKKVKRRPGGVISQKVYDGFKQYAPKMGAGALLGGIAGGLGILPFGLGTMAGSVIGSVGGMLGASDKVKELIFGKIEDPKSGLISKDFREKAKGAIKKYAPSSIAGALAGGTAWNLISGLGIIPGLSLLPGGPIFTALGGMMGMANAESFNKFLFGEESEEKGTDGKMHKVHKGGVFGKAFEFTKEKILTPLGAKINKAGESISKWFHDGIITPLENSIQPLKDEIGKAGNAIFDAFKNIGDKLTQALFGVFHADIGEGLGGFMKKKVLPKLDEMTNDMFSAIGKVIGGIISAPFKALELLVTGRIGGKTIEEINDEKVAERQQRKDGRDKRRRDRHFDAAKKAAKKGGEDAAGHAKSLWNRIFGNKGPNPKGFNGFASNDAETPIGGTPATQEAPIYKQDANGRWRDANGQFVSAAIADPNYNKNKTSGSDEVKGATNAEQKEKQSKKKVDQIGADNDKKADRKNDEELNRERNTKGRKGRDAKSYLVEIARHTRAIKDEIKGQVAGVGWNTAYIKAMLDAHWGPLSSDQLPEEMEGSTKNIKKKRGFIGRMIDRAKNGFGLFGDWVGDKVDKVKSGIGKVVDIVLTPFRLLGKAASATAKVIGGLGSSLRSLIGDLWEGLKKVGNLLYMGAETLMKTVGNFLINSAKGIGEAVGNGISMFTGMVKDAVLTGTAVIKGMVSTLAEAFPGIISFLGKGAVKFVKGAWNVAKGVGKLSVNAVTGAAGFVADRVIPGRREKKEKIKKKYLGNVNVSGGTLDEVKKVNIETIGGETVGIPFPHVNVIAGVAKAAGQHAIPVYVLGVDPLAKMHTIEGGNNSTNPTKADKEFKKEYQKADKAAERSSNPGEAYDKAVNNASTKNEIEAIQTAAAMNNTGGTVVGSTEGSEKKKGILSSLLEAFAGGGIKGIVTKIGGALLGIPVIGKIASALGVVKNIAGETAGIAGSGAMAALPGVFGAYNAAKEGNTGKAVNYGTRAFNSGLAAMLGRAGKSSFGVVRNGSAAVSLGIESAGIKLVSKISSGVQKLISSKAAQALLKKFPNAGPKIVKAVTDNLDKIALNIGKETAEQMLKKLNLVIMVATAVYDLSSGMYNAKQYFQVESDSITFGMRAAAGFAKAISGLCFGLIPISWLAQTIYGLFAGKEAKDQLKENQAEYKAKVASFNAMNGTDLSAEEYAKKYNDDGTKKKTLWDKIKGFFTGSGSGNSSTNEETVIGGSGYGRGHGMKQWSQKNSALNSFDPTMKSSGCGPVAAAMVASSYGKSANPVEASSLSYGSGMRAADGGTNPAFFSQYAASKGFSMGVGPTDSYTIQSNLSKNQPVVLMGKGGAFGPDTHYLVANKMNQNGSIGIVDPWTGGSRSVNARNLIGNTSATVYSSGKGWGRGTDAATLVPVVNANNSGGVSTAQAQQALVNKMISLSQHPIAYSLKGPQDPDQGSASCASTVAWAYRKVLGVKGMSPSSAIQSTDSRFTDIVRLGQPGAAPGKDFDISVLQPGDIIYMHNPTSNHTEMYIGNGKTMSHGGPGAGPNERTLDANRRKRVFAVRRYNDFVNNKTIKIIDSSAVTKDWNNADSNSSGEATDDYTSNTVGGKFLTSLTNAINPFTNKLGGILNTFLGNKDSSTSENGDSTNSSSNVTFGNINYTKYTPTESANKIWKYLNDNGYNKYAASGLMGCWQQESSNRADRVEGDYLPGFPGFQKTLESNQSLNNYTAGTLFPAYARSNISINKSGYLGNDNNYYPGIGLAQWTGPRGYNLLQYAKEHGKDWRDLETQLEFFSTEAANRGLKSKLNSANSVADATKKALDGYEMSSGFADKHPSEFNKRYGFATSIYNQYATDTDDPTTKMGLGRGRGKRLTTIPQLTSWGTGNSTNLTAMNEKIRNVNSVINKIRNEAETGSTVSQVTSAITNAVKETSVKSNGESDTAMLTLLTKSLATMIELLSDIKDNTKKSETEEATASGSTNNLPTARANIPASESGYGNNSTDIGASIIDSLTKK